VSSKHEKKPWEKLFILVPLAVLAAVLYTYGTKFWAQRLEGST
jgi:predicted membrane-bound mannosyltransferase